MDEERGSYQGERNSCKNKIVKGEEALYRQVRGFKHGHFAS